MTNKHKLILWVLALGLLIACANIAYQLLGKDAAPDNLADTQQKNPAPDFKVKYIDGFDLSELKGTPVVINFWASWCPPCKQELPDFEAMYKKYSPQVDFMMINVTDGAQETEKSAKAYLDSQNFTFPVYFDVYLQGSYAYGITSLPTTIFVDSEGNIVTYAVGMIDGETLEKGIKMILE